MRFFVIALSAPARRGALGKGVLAVQYTSIENDARACRLPEFTGSLSEVSAFAERLNLAVSTWPVNQDRESKVTATQ